MMRTISRLDKLTAAKSAFTQLGMMDGTMAEYTVIILSGEQPQPRAVPAAEDNKVDDHGPALGPKSLSSIELARAPGMLPCITYEQFMCAHMVHSVLEQHYPRNLQLLAEYIEQPHFLHLLQRFLYKQMHKVLAADVPIEDCPSIQSQIYIYHSAVAQFYAPSNLCGPGGMYHERIHSNPNWRGQSSFL